MARVVTTKFGIFVAERKPRTGWIVRNTATGEEHVALPDTKTAAIKQAERRHRAHRLHIENERLAKAAQG